MGQATRNLIMLAGLFTEISRQHSVLCTDFFGVLKTPPSHVIFFTEELGKNTYNYKEVKTD